MSTPSTNWGSPTTTLGTRTTYNTHITYNTHKYYNGTFAFTTPSSNWSNASTNSTNWSNS